MHPEAEFDISDAMSRALDLFKEHALVLVGTTVLAVVINGVVTAPANLLDIVTEVFADEIPREAMAGILQVKPIIQTVSSIFAFLTQAFFIFGVTRMNLAAVRGEPVSFSLLVIDGTSYARALGGSFLQSLALALGALCCVLPGLAAMVLLAFWNYAMVDEGIGAWASLERSVSLVKRNPLLVLGLGLVNMALFIFGVACCCIGVVLALPFTSLIWVQVYEHLRALPEAG